jgi:hypothetical protein
MKLDHNKYKKGIFIQIDKGIKIRDVEKILIREYGYVHYTKMKTTDGLANDLSNYIMEEIHPDDMISDGVYTFHLYLDENGKTITIVSNPDAIGDDHIWDGVYIPVIKGSKILRSSKINKIKNRILTKNKQLC